VLEELLSDNVAVTHLLHTTILPSDKVSILPSDKIWQPVDRICCLYLRNADWDGEKEFNATHQLVSDRVELLHCNTFLAFRYSMGIF
jgi:hypothetical protein